MGCPLSLDFGKMYSTSCIRSDAIGISLVHVVSLGSGMESERGSKPIGLESVTVTKGAGIGDISFIAGFCPRTYPRPWRGNLRRAPTYDSCLSFHHCAKTASATEWSCNA